MNAKTSLLEEVDRWANSLYAYPKGMIEFAMEAEPDAWEELPEKKSESVLPDWDYMWAFNYNSHESSWIEYPGSINKMSECGFRVYFHKKWGYIFGIDKAEGPFTEKYWLPLFIKIWGDENAYKKF